MVSYTWAERFEKQLQQVTEKRQIEIATQLEGTLGDGESASFRFDKNPLVTGSYQVDDGHLELKFDDIGLNAFNAMCYRDTLAVLLATHGSVSQSILYALWRIHSTGMLAHMGNGKIEYNPIDLEQWAVDTFGMVGDESYLRQWVFVVKRVLAPVWEAELSGVPFLNSEGNALTPEMVINMEKRLTHLISISSTFSKAERPQQEELLLAATDPETPRKEVRELVKEINDGGREIIHIPYYVEEKVVEGVEYRDVRLPNLDSKQFKLFKAALGAIGEQYFDNASGD